MTANYAVAVFQTKIHTGFFGADSTKYSGDMFCIVNTSVIPEPHLV